MDKSRVMANIFIALLIYGVAIIDTKEKRSKWTKEVRIDAAFNANKMTYFVSGNEVLETHQVKELRVFRGSDLRIPRKKRAQAAFKTLSSEDNLFPIWFYFDSYGKHVTSRTKARKLKYGPMRKFIRNGGPDAAGRRGDCNVYFFKGCEVIIRYAWNNWGKPTNVTQYGLPCDVDAAWLHFSGNDMMILKYDQVWTWKKNGSVEGPENFHDKYFVCSWVLQEQPAVESENS